MGMDVTDEEYVAEFGAPEELVGTPQLNDWMLDHVEKQNVQYWVEQGKDPKEAAAKARATKEEARRSINDRIAALGLRPNPAKDKTEDEQIMKF